MSDYKVSDERLRELDKWYACEYQDDIHGYPREQLEDMIAAYRERLYTANAIIEKLPPEIIDEYEILHSLGAV